MNEIKASPSRVKQFFRRTLMVMSLPTPFEGFACLAALTPRDDLKILPAGQAAPIPAQYLAGLANDRTLAAAGRWRERRFCHVTLLKGTL
jgi:hypothetical protein